MAQAGSRLLTGTGSDQRHLIVVMAADRGLCGGFNTNLVKEARKMVGELLAQGKEVKILCVGSKARDLVQREFRKLITRSFTGFAGKTGVHYSDANEVKEFILDQFDAGGFDICTLVYNEFRNVLIQKPKRQQLIPFTMPEVIQANDNQQETPANEGPISPYDFEPSEGEILKSLLPRNIGVQIFRALLDSAAGEQAARMTAMESATKNAGERIKDLTLQYNRARQAYITKELIEIISGAEAV
jgi:F-type H+-transporting ATPase subunit gamma